MLQEYQATVGVTAVKMPTDELGTADMVSASYSEETGLVEAYWTRAANANGYFVYAINTDLGKINTDYVIAVADEDDDTVRLIGLTRGDTYDIYVAATGSRGKFTLSEAARVTVR